MSSKFNVCEYCKNLFPASVIDLHLSTCPHRSIEANGDNEHDVGSEIVTIHNRRKLAKKEEDRLQFSTFLQSIYSEEAFDTFYMTALSTVERERSWLSSHKDVTIVDELVKDPGNEMIVSQNFVSKDNNLSITFFENDPELDYLTQYFSIAMVPLKDLNSEKEFQKIISNNDKSENIFSKNEKLMIEKHKQRVDYLLEKDFIQRFYVNLAHYTIDSDEKSHNILEIYDRVQHKRIHVYLLSDDKVAEFKILNLLIGDQTYNFPIDDEVTNDKISPTM